MTVIAGSTPFALGPWLNPANGLRTGEAPPAQFDPARMETVLGTGWLAERRSRYRIDYGQQQIRLRLGSQLDCRIDADGQWLALDDARCASVEALLGPPLLLALARRGIHALHASAVISPGGQSALISAPSGSGKSTLARVAEEQGWQRLADDLSPLDQQGQLRPRFPQLKLGPHPKLLPQSVPLQRLILLRRAAVTTCRPLSTTEVARALLAATVGARMYSAAMQREHFLWATEMARQLGDGQSAELTLAEDPQDPGRAARRGLAQLLEAWRRVGVEA